jgi:pimeloyl-ACP methyl ester carboxylesterase
LIRSGMLLPSRSSSSTSGFVVVPRRYIYVRTYTQVRKRAMMTSTPLVLVHGNPENDAVWGPLLVELGRDNAFTLSPPGFGVPASTTFPATVDGYAAWLVSQLESFGEPVDLVGHDWGGVHAIRVAMTRPDLIRSWASDALGVYAEDYVWHPAAQVWQQPGAGEASVKELFGGTLEQRIDVVGGLGMTGPTAVRVAAGMDDGMGTAVLSLLRSATQPAMAEIGRGLAKAQERKGLAIVATHDLENSNGTVTQHRVAADAAGAQVAMLDVGHWWPVQDPAPVAQALLGFWAQLRAEAVGTTIKERGPAARVHHGCPGP